MAFRNTPPTLSGLESSSSTSTSRGPGGSIRDPGRGIGAAFADGQAAPVEVEARHRADHRMARDEHARGRIGGREVGPERVERGGGQQHRARAEARRRQEVPHDGATLRDEEPTTEPELMVPQVAVVVEPRIGGIGDRLDGRRGVVTPDAVAPRRNVVGSSPERVVTPDSARSVTPASIHGAALDFARAARYHARLMADPEPMEPDARAEADVLFDLVRRRYGSRLAPHSSRAFARASRAWSKQRARFAPCGSTTATSPCRRSPLTAPTPDARRGRSRLLAPSGELAEWVRTRRVSPVALAEVFLDRLETLGPRYNAVVTLTRDRALDEARRAEREIAAGRYRGPLHGIPYGAKDLLATAGGIPTTWGAAPFRDQTFDADATVVRKLEEAGARARRQAGHGRAGRRHGLSRSRTPRSPARGSTRGTRRPGAAARRADRASPSRPGWCRSRSARRRGARSSLRPETAASPGFGRRTVA